MAIAGMFNESGMFGIGGGEAGLGAEGQVAVYCAEGVEERRVVGQSGGGTVSDGFVSNSGGGVAGILPGKGGDGVGEDAGDVVGAGGEQVGGIGGTEVEGGGAVADSGMELMEVPPEMWPTFRVVC